VLGPESGLCATVRFCRPCGTGREYYVEFPALKRWAIFGASLRDLFEREIVSENWKSEAVRRFPELGDKVEGWETPYLLWFDLRDAFEAAYRVVPRDEGMIRRVYEFADWCLEQPQGRKADDDLGTCVTVCFYEHIPESPEALADMPRWFKRQNVLEMREVFSYMVGEEGFRRVLEAFDNYQKQVLSKFPAKGKRR
jgi:hypothetical protein